VLRQGGKDAAIFSAKGLILMEQSKPEEAVVVLHEALAINPQDSIATELLNKALEETALIDGAAESEAEDLLDFERTLGQRKHDAAVKVNGGRKTAGRTEKGKGRLRRTRRMTVLEDEDGSPEKEGSMMEMSDDE
jgi:anaphase-promoting complex subunit 6